MINTKTSQTALELINSPPFFLLHGFCNKMMARNYAEVIQCMPNKVYNKNNYIKPIRITLRYVTSADDAWMTSERIYIRYA